MAVALKRPSLDEQVRDVAAYAQEHLSSKEYWCEGAYARTLTGTMCAPNYGGASYWSLSGALRLAALALDAHWHHVLDRCNRLAQAWGYRDVAFLNDDGGYDVVKAFLDEASKGVDL